MFILVYDTVTVDLIFFLVHFFCRKRLRGEIGRLFPGIPPERLNEVVPNKEEMSVMKLYTHSGESVIVYCLQRNPAFFEIEKQIYPTGEK